MSMVDRMPTWLLAEDGGWSRVPDDDGWVNPHSCDDVWHAADLEPPSPKLCVGMHIRDGTLRHVFPAVDLDVAGYRNRGMKTVPRAHSWLSFGAALPTELSLHAGARTVPAGDTLARAVEALADSPPPELGKGSHVVHAVVAGADPLPPLLVRRPSGRAADGSRHRRGCHVDSPWKESRHGCDADVRSGPARAAGLDSRPGGAPRGLLIRRALRRAGPGGGRESRRVRRPRRRDRGRRVVGPPPRGLPGLVRGRVKLGISTSRPRRRRDSSPK